jgi:hypothetical protein
VSANELTSADDKWLSLARTRPALDRKSIATHIKRPAFIQLSMLK